MTEDVILPWHQDAWAQVARQRSANRLAHAYLVSGLPGSGRHAFVQCLAAWLLCEQPAEVACGRCGQCLLYLGGNHPDVLDISPEENSKAIKIEQIRRITQFVNQTANQAGAFKIIILHPAEALGTAAANALLKNLEEPPGKTLFLLVAEAGSRLLPTIRSRCQPLPLAAPETAQALAWLQSRSAAETDALRSAEALAPGRPMFALELLEQGIPAWRELMLEKLADLEAGRLSASDLAKFCANQPPLYAIELLQLRAAERLRQQMLEDAAGLTSQDGRNSQNRPHLEAMFDYQRELCRVNTLLTSGANPNAQLALEHLFTLWKICTGNLNVSDKVLANLWTYVRYP